MTITSILLVGAGATTGSVLRYGIGKVVPKVTGSDFPWGTWFINVMGAFLLGLFFREFGTTPHDLNWWLLLGTGFCGGFTTFSTMSIETLRLIRSNKMQAIIYLGSSLALGCFLVWIAA